MAVGCLIAAYILQAPLVVVQIMTVVSQKAEVAGGCSCPTKPQTEEVELDGWTSATAVHIPSPTDCPQPFTLVSADNKVVFFFQCSTTLILAKGLSTSPIAAISLQLAASQNSLSLQRGRIFEHFPNSNQNL